MHAGDSSLHACRNADGRIAGRIDADCLDISESHVLERTARSTSHLCARRVRSLRMGFAAVPGRPNGFTLSKPLATGNLSITLVLNQHEFIIHNNLERTNRS
jgi:hypothetical protein